jgi:hypothetical protein
LLNNSPELHKAILVQETRIAITFFPILWSYH